MLSIAKSMVKYAINTPKGKEEYNIVDWGSKDKDDRPHNDLVVKNHDNHLQNHKPFESDQGWKIFSPNK